jgi:hypothetical protein
MFLKLTKIDKDGIIHINPFHIVSLEEKICGLLRNSYTLIRVSSIPDYGFSVLESPEEIIALFINA